MSTELYDLILPDMAAAFEKGIIVTDHGLEWRVPSDRGYGKCYWTCNGFEVQVRAHRAAWMLANGPIPEGHVIDHEPTCPKTCVTASHLQALTIAEHSKLGWERGELNGGWGTKRERIHPPRPTPFAWKIEKACKNCGKSFVPDTPVGVHCSRECHQAYKVTLRKSRRNPRPETRICAWEPCKQEFEPKRIDSFLCSRKCIDAVQNEKKRKKAA